MSSLFGRPEDLDLLTPLERATRLQEIIIERATSTGPFDGNSYKVLREEFFADPDTRDLLPSFVRTCRQLNQTWPGLQAKGGYQVRKSFVWAQFESLLSHLEGTRKKPADDDVSDVLTRLDPHGVHAVWSKALARRESDPEGAITSARTLLETVCKHILDARGVRYDGKGDLPELYKATSTELRLAPGQYSEETFRKILGGVTSVVTELGSLRNKHGDAHGQGRGAASPKNRHASLAVNLAGSIAMFLVETFHARDQGR